MARSATLKKIGRDAKYLSWIRTQRCAIPFCTSNRWPDEYSSQIEAAHVGQRGLSQKCSDLETVPLCMFHHRTGPHAHHVLGKKFWTLHGLDKDAIIKELQGKYEKENA